MVFPYPTYYPNQREMIKFISSAIRSGKNPVFESPTGSGKTIAVLSALLPIARKKGKKIFYLCRTHEQMDRVIEELKMISKRELASGLSMRSRRDLCLNEFIRENAKTPAEERLACSILKKEGKCSYYKKLGKGGLKLDRPKTSSEVLVECKQLGICPYEHMKLMLSDCDVVACSYLYIFEPGIQAALLKSTGFALEDLILVLDEAHNLPRLAGNIAGERLTEFAVNRAIKEAEDFGVEEGIDLLGKLHKYVILNESEETRLERDLLLRYLDEEINSAYALQDIGEKIKAKKLAKGKRPISFIHACATFIISWLDSSDSDYAFFTSKTVKGMPYLEILSLEPKNITVPPLEGAYLTVHMSGTLTPIKPYCEVVGLSNFAPKSFPSPFPKENIVAYVDTSVSTMGSRRSPEEYQKIAKKIKVIVSKIPGNVLVFFPSYTVLNSVLNQKIEVGKQAFLERSDMDSSDNNEMIKRFKSSKDAVLFGVQQGRNSEGQDFPGEQANAVIVVGIPYAVRGPKVNAQIEYYKKRYKGWWGRHTLGDYYAYYLPAYRSLNQTAGRAHRSLSDKAAIIFLEQRVARDGKVKQNIAPWIKENMIVPKESEKEKIEKEIERFYTRSN
jgi:DNA excision repair protein ERCC-2